MAIAGFDCLGMYLFQSQFDQLISSDEEPLDVEAIEKSRGESENIEECEDIIRWVGILQERAPRTKREVVDSGRLRLKMVSREIAPSPRPVLARTGVAATLSSLLTSKPPSFPDFYFMNEIL